MHFRQWKRRELISLLGGAAAAGPSAGHARSSRRCRSSAVTSSARSPDARGADRRSFLKAFVATSIRGRSQRCNRIPLRGRYGTNVCRYLRPISSANEWRCWSPPIDPISVDLAAKAATATVPIGFTSGLVRVDIGSGRQLQSAGRQCYGCGLVQNPNSGQSLSGALTRAIRETGHDCLCCQPKVRRDAVSGRGDAGRTQAVATIAQRGRGWD